MKSHQHVRDKHAAHQTYLKTIQPIGTSRVKMQLTHTLGTRMSQSLPTSLAYVPN